MTEQVCAYEKCSESFTPKRPHQRFHHESCRYAQWEIDKEREPASGKGAKSGVYVFTKYGRETLVRLSSEDFRGVVLAAESDQEQESVGVADGAGDLAPRDGLIGNSGAGSGNDSPAPEKGDAVTSPPTVAVDTGPSPDSLVQLDEGRRAPSMYDAWEAA